ncbi:MAG TPA: tRNA (guanine-N7)-methyltransferase [Polyangiaceae bacterium]
MSEPNRYEHAPRLPEGSLDPGALVGGPGQPVELEVGPGRGAFAFERLAAVPSARLIGFEIKRKWATIVDERLSQRGLGARGRVFFEDARIALPRFPENSVSIAYFHFPDPWWKKRHKKRLVLTPALLEELARVIVSRGELFVQTDVEERAFEYESMIGQHAEFRAAEREARVLQNPYQAMSPRERRAVQDGLPIFRLRYARV